MSRILKYFHVRSYLRFRRWPAMLHPALSAACLLVLTGCGEPLVPDPPPSHLAPPVEASVVSGSPVAAMSADGEKLPSVKEVIEELTKPGCVIHHRTLSDLYAEYRGELEFTPSALEASGRSRVLLYGVNVTVKRSDGDGGEETLPKGLGTRIVCKIPDTALGESEAEAWIEAFLREKGIDIAADPAQASADRGPLSEVAQLAWSGVREVWRRLAPRPLSAAQSRTTYTEFDCETWAETGDAGINCTRIEITVTCPSGFDYEASSGLCVGGTRSSPPISVVVTRPGGSGGGGTDPTNPDDDDDEGTCTDDQRAIAEEYDDPAVWPCDAFTHSVTDGGNHDHTTGYLSDDYLSGSASVLSAVSGAWINSDWRCPTGNAALPKSSSKSQHVQGTAGDFDATGFDLDLWGEFKTAAIAAGASAWSKYPGTSECAASPSKWCYSTYIHIDWR